MTSNPLAVLNSTVTAKRRGSAYEWKSGLYRWGGLVEGHAREFLGDAPDPVGFGVVS